MHLDVVELSCHRGGRLVFRDLGFSASGGDAIILRGPNGAGKSSLLRIIAGFLRPSAGTVELDGVSLSADRGAIQEQIAYAGHLDAVKPAQSVRSNLAAWAQMFLADGALVEPTLDHFDLLHVADQRAAWCSAGQKRRLGLARLCITNRPLWLLDEPTVSLDADSTRIIAGLIDRHCAGGGIALIATHGDLGLRTGRVIKMQSEPSPAEDEPQSGNVGFLDGDWT